MNGALIYDDYYNLIKKDHISGLIDEKSQVQPSSIDLTLSEECYEIKASFLSPKNKVRGKLKKKILQKN